MHRFLIILLVICAVSVGFGEEFFHCRSVDDKILNCELNKSVPPDSLWQIQERTFAKTYGGNITCFNFSDFCSYNKTHITFNEFLTWLMWDGFRLYLGPYMQEFDKSSVSFPYPPRVEISYVGQDFANISIANFTNKKRWSYFVISENRRISCKKWCLMNNLECGHHYEACAIAKFNRISNSTCANVKFRTKDCIIATDSFDIAFWIPVVVCLNITIIVVIGTVFKCWPSISKFIFQPLPKNNAVPQSSPVMRREYDYITTNCSYEPFPIAVNELDRQLFSPPELPPRNPSMTDSSFEKESSNTVSDSGVYSQIHMQPLPVSNSNADVYEVGKLNLRNVKL